MRTVLEIQQAIERLPREQLGELREWFVENASMTAASATVLSLYDQEEGEGQQWED